MRLQYCSTNQCGHHKTGRLQENTIIRQHQKCSIWGTSHNVNEFSTIA